MFQPILLVREAAPSLAVLLCLGLVVVLGGLLLLSRLFFPGRMWGWRRPYWGPRPWGWRGRRFRRW